MPTLDIFPVITVNGCPSTYASNAPPQTGSVNVQTIITIRAQTNALSTQADLAGGPSWVDAVEKVFFGWSTKILKTADALRALRLEDPHRFTQKRPTAFVLAPEYLAAAAVSKKRLSRDFRCLSIFDFYDSIGQKRRFEPPAVTSGLPRIVLQNSSAAAEPPF